MTNLIFLKKNLRSAPFAENLFNNTVKDSIVNVIQNLSVKERVILTLCYCESISYDDAAYYLKISKKEVETVYNKVVTDTLQIS